MKDLLIHRKNKHILIINAREISTIEINNAVIFINVSSNIRQFQFISVSNSEHNRNAILSMNSSSVQMVKLYEEDNENHFEEDQKITELTSMIEKSIDSLSENNNLSKNDLW